MRRIFTICALSLASFLGVSAQTPADSAMIADAGWKQTVVANGVIAQEASFPSLYGVPQHIVIVRVLPNYGMLEVVRHNSFERTSEVAVREGADAAINGSFFDGKARSVCFFQKDGTVIDVSQEDVLKNLANGAVEIDGGKLAIIRWSKDVEQNYGKKERDVLASGPMLVFDGADCDMTHCNKKFYETRHPRSVVAEMKNGEIWLIAVDGRAKGNAEGMSLPQLQHFVRVLGADDALNFDGGGSTTLWTMPCGVMNCPTDNRKFDHEGERRVANSLLVR